MNIDKYELYNTRLLVFLEVAPQSNNYQQVLFTQEEFKKTSETIGNVVLVEGDDLTVAMNLSTEIYKLPDLQQIVG